MRRSVMHTWQAWAQTESTIHRGMMSYVTRRFQKCTTSKRGSLIVLFFWFEYKFESSLVAAPHLFRPKHERMCTLKTIAQEKLKAGSCNQECFSILIEITQEANMLNDKGKRVCKPRGKNYRQQRSKETAEKKENENACWEDSIASAEASSSNSTPERVKDAQEVANKQGEKTSNSVEEEEEEEVDMYDVADWNDSDTVHGHSQPEPDEIPPAAEGAEGDEQAVEPTSGEPNVKDPDELGGELHSEEDSEKPKASGKDRVSTPRKSYHP